MQHASSPCRILVHVVLIAHTLNGPERIDGGWRLGRSLEHRQEVLHDVCVSKDFLEAFGINGISSCIQATV